MSLEAIKHRWRMADPTSGTGKDIWDLIAVAEAAQRALLEFPHPGHQNERIWEHEARRILATALSHFKDA